MLEFVEWRLLLSVENRSSRIIYRHEANRFLRDIKDTSDWTLELLDKGDMAKRASSK